MPVAVCYTVLYPYLGHIKSDIQLESESKALSPLIFQPSFYVINSSFMVHIQNGTKL